MSRSNPELDQLCVNALRFLAVDMVERAKSGHPGMPLGAAPMAYVLWDRFLRFDPENPEWFGRDRFLLSAGHGSALLYALLHLYGFDLPIAELENFRQWGSKTPGHPEYHHTPGVDATTGPLGQGFGMGVGMALAERYLQDTFAPGSDGLCDFNVYGIVSDGDLMEGIAAEAASLAGHLRLGRLIYLYDDNEVSLDGPTKWAFTEDTQKRFDAYGWHTQLVEDGNDLEAISDAIEAARQEKDKPSIVFVRTVIGYGSPKAGTKDAHGEPLGADATRITKEKLGWPLEPPFYVPIEAREHARKAIERGREAHRLWKETLDAFKQNSPKQAQQFEDVLNTELPEGWSSEIDKLEFSDDPIATRDAGKQALNALAEKVPALFGGAADLSSSTKTIITSSQKFEAENPGRNVFFGVREHAMGAAVNGASLTRLIAYGSTFLTFSDYMKPAIRLAALMDVHSLFIFTHDSVGLGEDGPTHQPVEHVMALRLVPNLDVYRSADAWETKACWKLAVERQGPACLIFSRQKLPVLSAYRAAIEEGVPNGGYVLSPAERKPQVVLVATGSEVATCLEAQSLLSVKGIDASVVSMPCMEIFFEQDDEYRHSVLPPGVPKLAVEAGASLGWERITGEMSAVLGVDKFGASAPGNRVLSEYGFTPVNVADTAEQLVEAKK
ncbi:MAG: transketolase [Fimbriimonadaceae bacterium]